MTGITLAALRNRRNQSAEDYVGRHHTDTVQTVPAGWTPLTPATRQHLAPHHYADTALPAGVDQPTAHFDRAALKAACAPIQGQPPTWPEVLAALRDDMDQTAPTEILPAVGDEQDGASQ
ncbi:hypothetical protein EYA84_02210 [Verrucosispora sp. SN26_14.1]|uniref:hypothetical protein n=1 Tax=Verrucosispora sp. SN26_14.1 TaxID=2527879 RepID=UPI0010338435|nr:hypothetical protein [Verrucosispora sp. SN26_14.1]TBL44277.1 hypothetical protein EYA84_02210 [Verrucosispora sp. SN26_14.1]